MKIRGYIAGLYLLSLATPVATFAQAQGHGLEGVKAVAAKRLVYEVPGMDNVMVRSNLVYKRTDAEELKADVYRPTGLTKGEKRPAVIFIHGGFLPRNLPIQPKDWNVFVSYGKVAAASGMIGVTFNHRLYESWASVPNSESDLVDLIAYLRNNADDLGVDEDHLTLWAFSGGGPLLSLAMRAPLPYIRCLVSYYSLLDLEQTSKETRGTLPDQALVDFSPLH